MSNESERHKMTGLDGFFIMAKLEHCSKWNKQMKEKGETKIYK